MAKVTRKKMARGVELTVDQVFEPITDMRLQLTTSNIESEQMQRGEGTFRLNLNIPWLGSKYFHDNRTSGTTASLTDAGTGYIVSNLATTAVVATGDGLTVDILEVGAGGEIERFRINRPGTGYSDGDTVTVDGGVTLAGLTLSVQPDKFDNPYYIPFCLPPLQENIGGTDAEPVLGPNAPFPVLEEISFSLDQSDEPAAILDHWYGRDKYQYHPARRWMPNPSGGKKTYDRTDAYEFTVSIYEKEQTFFNASPPETDTLGVGGEAVSLKIPASAFISRSTRFNPISVGDINRQFHPLKTYCLAIFAPKLHDISAIQREHCAAVNVWVSLKFKMPLVERDTAAEAVPHLVQNIPLHYGARTGPTINIASPAAGDLVIADGQDGGGAEVGISTNLQQLDEQFSSKLRGGYSDFAQAYPTQTIRDDAAYEIMAVPLGAGFPHNRMSARDDYPLAPYVAGSSFGAAPPLVYAENPYVDRRIIPIDGDMTIHHILVALNWTSDLIQDMYDPADATFAGKVVYGKPSIPGTLGSIGGVYYDVGVAMLTGPRADLFEYQQIALSSFLSTSLPSAPDGIVDIIKMGLPACDNMPLEWVIGSVPIRHQAAIPSPTNGKGYWGFSGETGPWNRGEQGRPWFVGEGNTYTRNRTPVGDGAVAPAAVEPFRATHNDDNSEGTEKFLEVRLRVDPNAPVYSTTGGLPQISTFDTNYQQRDIFLGYGGCWVYIIGKKHLK